MNAFPPSDITPETIRRLAVGQRIYAGSPRGFGVRGTPTGASWFIRWKVAGKHREISLGPCSETTRTQALRQAEKLRAEIIRGVDPVASRRALRASQAAQQARTTLGDFAKVYIASVAKKPASKRMDQTLLKLHLLPLLGRIPVADITKDHAQKLHASMSEKPVMANRAHALLSHLIAEACRLGLREAPLPRGCITKHKEEPRSRYLSPAEHARLWKILGSMETSVHRDGAQALKLLLLSGCRKNEIIRLGWNEVDFDAGCLRLADSKTGRRTVPLAPAAVAVLRSREQQKCCDWVFPSEDLRGPRDNIERAWRKAREQANLAGVRIHDLRHSVAATGIAAGLTLPEIGKILGHRSPQTTARYAHVADEVARAAVERVGARMAEIVAAAEGLRVVK